MRRLSSVCSRGKIPSAGKGARRSFVVDVDVDVEVELDAAAVASLANACCSEELKGAIFVASRFEAAYNVVKNARSSVTRSAYDTSHRSWPARWILVAF